MITMMYTFHNRLEYNKIVFPQILKEVKENEYLIKDFFIYDDMSDDGSSEYIKKMLKINNIHYNLIRKEYNSSVTQLQDTIDKCTTKYILKIDSDILIPDKYISTLFNIMESNNFIGFLSAESIDSLPYIIDNITLIKTKNIGGVGIFKRNVFNEKLVSNNIYYGFTEFQWKSKYQKFWINGVSMCDLDKSLAYSRIEEYSKLGLTRNNKTDFIKK